MKFSIITPTHKRKDKLTRAVTSLLTQTYTDWEMIIINDSPYDETYKEFASSINDARIHYHVNSKNNGVNYSRNHALDKLSADSKWIIFLDDDDYLAPDTLATFHELILLHSNQRWFVTNRAYRHGESITKFPHDDMLYSYVWQYLILKRCKGDATHCIETKLITHIHAHFSRHVKQGEEWFFFCQIGLHSKMFYHDHNSTISDGYSIDQGLNFRKRSMSEQIETISKLLYEGKQSSLFYSFSFFAYIGLRILRIPYSLLHKV